MLDSDSDVGVVDQAEHVQNASMHIGSVKRQMYAIRILQQRTPVSSVAGVRYSITEFSPDLNGLIDRAAIQKSNKVCPSVDAEHIRVMAIKHKLCVVAKN